MRNKQKLQELAYQTSLLYAAELPGEEFHPDYSKDKDIFRRLVKSDRQLESGLNKYFSGLSSRLLDSANWSAYEIRVANVVDDLFDQMVTVSWNDEVLSIKILITKALKEAIIAGGNLTEKETKVDIGWNANAPTAIDFIDSHGLSLAKRLTKTTEEKIKSALKLSLNNGEKTSEAKKRINEIIDDPRRSATIAHTEAVNAFSMGRLETARQIGADRKEWHTTIKPCEICRPMNKQIVKIDESFLTGLGDKVDAPAAHPNCRCAVRILMPTEKR